MVYTTIIVLQVFISILIFFVSEDTSTYIINRQKKSFYFVIYLILSFIVGADYVSSSFGSGSWLSSLPIVILFMPGIIVVVSFFIPGIGMIAPLSIFVLSKRNKKEEIKNQNKRKIERRSKERSGKINTIDSTKNSYASLMLKPIKNKIKTVKPEKKSALLNDLITKNKQILLKTQKERLRMESNRNQISKCEICYSQIKRGEYTYVMLCCNSLFHYLHGREWINKKRKCPYCRIRVSRKKYTVTALI